MTMSTSWTLNLKTGLGEFSLKDPDYGNYVLAQLARVL